MPVKNQWTEELERLRKDNNSLLTFIKELFKTCPYDEFDEVVRPGECAPIGKGCSYEGKVKDCWQIYINKKHGG